MIIQAKGLTKKFNGLTAVDNISFDVAESEILGFLGPNGAGKTTTIRMLAALISPTWGSITIDGRDSREGSTHIRTIIGILTESPGMYEKISAYGNLSYFSSFYKMDDFRRKKNIEKFLKMFDLWDRKDELVGTYSKGMKQKLALARALIHEPRILFLDEPTSGLDPESARLVRDYIHSLKKDNTTVILCTHNLHEASALSDRVCILKKKIIMVSSLSRLQGFKKTSSAQIILDRPADKFVSIISEIEGVADIRAEGKIIDLSVSFPDKTNPKIVNRLAAEGAGIVYFNEVKESLEDIYLQLIREEENG